MQAPHCSPYVIHNGLVYVSGQLPVLPAEPKVPLGIEAQTLLVLEKLSQVLADAGTEKSNWLQIRIYISAITCWGTVNEICKIYGHT